MVVESLTPIKAVPVLENRLVIMPGSTKDDVRIFRVQTGDLIIYRFDIPLGILKRFKKESDG